MNAFPKQPAVRVPGVEEIAKTICNTYGGDVWPMRWHNSDEDARSKYRAEAEAVQALMYTPAPKLTKAQEREVVRFDLHRPQGPVEFDFTPGGGDGA